MRIFWLTTFAMVAFAANSVLTRYALALDQIGPGAFVAVRLLSGAVMLALLVGLRVGGFRGQGGLIPAAALLLYAAAFSYAYVSLDAGLGALILFGIVQITMFIGAIINGEKPRLRRWLGMLAGMLGLAVLFAPGAARPDITGAILMGFAGFGWGLYSLIGKSTAQPLQASARNFLIAAPFGIIIWLIFPQGPAITSAGVGLAVVSGAVASGIGYAVWYGALPRLQSSLAAIVQLSVPIIALAGGMVFLDERIGITFVISTVLIVGGIALAVSAKR